MIDGLSIETNKGRVWSVGGTGGEEFDFELPAGYTVGAIRGGYGGHLHNISIMKTSVFTCGPHVKHTEVGGHHGDTNEWCDEGFLSANPSARIHSVTGIHGNYCLGLEVTYDVNGEKISAGKHYGSNADSGAELTLELDHDEIIVAAWGGCGALIDRLCLRTNKGKEIRFGESDGGDDFEFKIPPGCHIIAFHGGHNGDMHNIGAYARRRVAKYSKFL